MILNSIYWEGKATELWAFEGQGLGTFENSLVMG